MGAKAKPAIPVLQRLIKMKPDAKGFPNDRQKEAYRYALAKIQAAVADEKGGNGPDNK